METSDSECFESAGEEFYSDDEKTKPSEKELVSKTKTLEIRDKTKSAKKWDEKTSEKRKTTERRAEGNLSKPGVKAESGSQNFAKNDQNLWEVEHFDMPPTRSVCWEPGMDYDIEETDNKDESVAGGQPDVIKGEETSTKSLLVEHSKIETNRKVEESQKEAFLKSDRKGFGVPPQIVGCWEEGVNTIPLKNKPTPYKPKESEITQCSEKLDSITSPPIKEPSKHARPEFGIPPKKVVCPFPVQHKRKLEEVVKKTVKDEEENMWDNDDWSIEEDNTIVEAEKPKIEDTNKKEDSSQNRKEENMWEDDNWDDFENSNKPKLSEKTQKEEGNMWEDDWEPIENIPRMDSKADIQEESKKDTGWGSWGSWGLSSVISTATNITNQVSQSITTVLESGIGAPDPESLAKIDREIEKELQEVTDVKEEERQEEEKPILGFGLGNLVHGMTKLVETTGSKVITGGLDTLETIGKKTMEVLQDNDPGLKKKRAFLKLNDDKPILSTILREAKEKAEEENRELVKKHLVVKRPNYETLFDDHQGLVHLEALEMLSKQCDIKLSSLLDASSGETLQDIQETMDQIKELCELPEDEEEETISTEELKENLLTGVKELNVPITYDRLFSTWVDIESWLENTDINILDSKEIHQQAIESLAQLTAIAVEQFHKGGELLLIKQHRSTADEADSLVQLTMTLTAFIGIVSAKFSGKLSMVVENGADKKEVNELITNVFLEAANSSTYIRNAFQLLIPVLQVGAV